ncbi:MAG: dihydroorotase [Gemmatimonadetes bacterium]|nr:dihydroorotase [Gemmatimonadota bacterium]
MSDGLSGIVLRGGRVLDPGSERDEIADVRIAGDTVTAIEKRVEPESRDRVIELDGMLVTSGLVDPHVHLREPGGEAKETIATGAAAGVAGGFTTICAMPNTEPVIDTPERVRHVIERGRSARMARVLPIGAATRGSAGETPTDARSLAAAGAVALSDDGQPISTAEMLGRVLSNAARAGLVVADHCEDLRLSLGGVVRAGQVADRLGVRGIPPEAESAAVERDLEVLARVGGRLHLCHLSTTESVRLVREAKQAGLSVTAEACPHHLTLTVDCAEIHGSIAKMNPPLAETGDREALVEALADGTIDCIATDHAPHTDVEKARALGEAPFGVIGLETAFGVVYTELVERGAVGLRTLLDRMTVGPARVFGLEGGRIKVGAPADVAVFDLDQEWKVEPAEFRSKARNTPWAGARLRGQPRLTIVAGEIVFDGR